MENKISYWIGIGLAIIAFIGTIVYIILSDSVGFQSPIFMFMMGISIIIGIIPFVVTIIKDAREAEEKEQMFIEFSRNLVESVKTGTPVSKSVINLKDKPYGVLSRHVKKLANQISLGIPFSVALQIFSKDIKNKPISRSLTLIGQAEKAGGNIGEILEAVAEAVTLSDKLKKERKSAISNLVVQGYIIFFVFLVIILVMQFRILPLLNNSNLSGGGGSDIGSLTGIGGIGGGGELDFSNAFLYLLLIQGLFSGLTIGLLAEGNLKGGVKHSFALMLISFLISQGANVLFQTDTTKTAAAAVLIIMYFKYKK